MGEKQLPPRLLAKFVLNKQGSPQWDEEGNGYWIRLSIADAPDDTYAVTYELDESYYDPIRVSRRKRTFDEDITSYGDYTVKASVRRKERTDAIAVLLSRALDEGHRKDMNDAIRKAIRDISKN